MSPALPSTPPVRTGRPLASLGGVLSLAFALLASAPAPAIDLPGPATQVTLPNGLRVLLVERHEAPTFSAHLRFGVGSADDPPGATGLAHLVEHMRFKGTREFGVTDPDAEAPLLAQLDALEDALQQADPSDTSRRAALEQAHARLAAAAGRFVVPNEFWETLRRHGGTHINAMTVRDSTQYTVNLPRNQVALWALLEADRLRTPVFREFASELEVIREEYRLMVETNPTARLQVAAYGAAFGPTPYQHPIWGWPADLDRMTRPQAMAFAATYYVPNNAWLVLVGDLDPAVVLPLVERAFGDIPARPLPPRPAWTLPDQTALRRVTVAYPAEPQLVVYFQVPPSGPETEALSLLAHLLVTGRTARLHRALVEEQRIATGVTADTSWLLRHAGLFSLLGLPRAPHTLAELEAGVLEEVERLRSEPVSPEELERVQNQAELTLAQELRSNAGLAAQLARSWDLDGDWRALFARPAHIQAVTAERLREVARRYLTPERCTIGWLVRASEGPAERPPSMRVPVPFETEPPE